MNGRHTGHKQVVQCILSASLVIVSEIYRVILSITSTTRGFHRSQRPETRHFLVSHQLKRVSQLSLRHSKRICERSRRLSTILPLPFQYLPEAETSSIHPLQNHVNKIVTIRRSLLVEEAISISPSSRLIWITRT